MLFASDLVVMSSSTLNRPLVSVINAQHTYKQDPPSPTSLNYTIKRQKRKLSITAPPYLNLGGSLNNINTASKAISSQLDALKRDIKL